METWSTYRAVWAEYPLLMLYAIIVVAVLVLAVIGTLERNLLAILFIPSLAGGYVHHLMVMKRAPH